MFLNCSWRSKVHTETIGTQSRKYASFPYLILDDIGAEKSTDRSIVQLYTIINHRNNELLPTIYTTNLTLPEIEQYLGPRIASRMATARVITLDLPEIN